MKIPLDLPAGISTDDTDFTTTAYLDGSNIRFWRGRAEVIGGWELLSTTALAGVCRTVFGWTDGDGFQCFAFGLHNGLTVWESGDQVEITPVATSATGTITVSGTPVANETFVVGTQTFTFKVTRTGLGEVTISAVNATQATNIAAAITADIPLQVSAVADGAVVNLTTIATGLAANDTVLTESATGIAVAGFDHASAAFVPGQIDGTGSVGYGTGSYGLGDYGEPSTEDYFPLTWSFGSRFGALYANPRGQGIYRWDNDTTALAETLDGSPARVNFMLSLSTGQIMALGCTDTGGLYNQACIRISDALDPEQWAITTESVIAGSTAQQYLLEGNGRIVGARAIGQYVFVWTDSELHVGTYTTEWTFERVATSCGLAGPNAAVVVGSAAYWISPDLQFWACPIGGYPALITSNDGKPCPVRDSFARNASASQNDKIVAASVAERGEILWSYADAREGFENSRIIRLSIVDGAWSLGELARTAFVDSGPAISPVGVTFEGDIYWHERGSSANGAPLPWYLETGSLYLSDAEDQMMLTKWWPDFRDQLGAIWLTIYTRDYPQGPETEWGPYTATAEKPWVDLRVTGRTARFRWEGNTSPAFARFGKQTFDAQRAGRR